MNRLWTEHTSSSDETTIATKPPNERLIVYFINDPKSGVKHIKKYIKYLIMEAIFEGKWDLFEGGGGKRVCTARRFRM
jgi:hypothetical protein